MLRTRVLTALVLIPLVLAALFLLPPLGWALVTFAVALIAAWEWSRMAQFPAAGSAAFLAATLALGGAFLGSYASGPIPAGFYLLPFGAAAAFWIVVAPLWLARGWRPRSRAALALTGWVVILPTWLALVALRELNPVVLLGLMAVVWVADIAAYFAGKRFGKHKLAPAVSPGKTWEGVAGALAGVLVYALIWVAAPAMQDSTRLSGLLLVPLLLGLACLSIVGDLFESWMKRGAGMKDSSQILPGHGGILDRIDALTSALPVAALVLSVAGLR